MALSGRDKNKRRKEGQTVDENEKSTISTDKYTSYHLYISDDLINEIVSIGKESLKGLMPYKV